MKRSLGIALLAAAAAFVCVALRYNSAAVHAQPRPTAADNPHVALGLALRKLGVSATFMQVAAHPDDEHNALYALFGLGMGMRAICLQTTRGEGGQNEIGPELFREMGVLRTSELQSAHRIDGGEQYFTRAIDYGYSFDPNEVIGKWGRQEIIGDFVRLIRTLRPDVMLTMGIQGGGGDRAHEATSVLSHEAYLEAGDPTKYPEQIKEGLHAWQPRKLYIAGGFGGGRGNAPSGNMTQVNTGATDSLLGRSYNDIGNEARSMHKCQGMGNFTGGGRGGGGGGGRSYRLAESSLPGQLNKNESGMFDDIDTSITGIARYAGPNPPAGLTAGLAKVADAAKRAQAAFDAGRDADTAAPIEEGLNAIRALREGLKNTTLSADARYEIDFRLNQKERDYEDAVIAAHGITFEAIAGDGLVVRGQPLHVSVTAQNHGATDVTVHAEVAGIENATCAAGPAKKDGTFACAANGRVPASAAITSPYFDDDYWKHPANPAINKFAPGVPFGIPFAASPFHVTFHVKTAATEVSKTVPIQFQYSKDSGEKRMELNVEPAFSVRVEPPLAVFPEHAGPREVHVTVVNSTKGASRADVSLEAPAGWKVSPTNVPLEFKSEDQSLSARFEVTAPPQSKAGSYKLRAVVTSPSAAGQKFSTGYETIEYPHVERRQLMLPAEAELKVIDVKVAPGLKAGYINGSGDLVPPAIEQLGVKLNFIERDELASGDLSKYDVIMTGVRAYERRDDLEKYNQRLLDYAEHGGTVIVQYNKNEFNRGQYGPFPARVGPGRVSDENVPVKVLVPNHPVFNFPNKIGPDAWANWVQERGLYFLGEKDKRYVDLVTMTDSFPDNPGEKLGSFVEARTGNGRWIYLGLALWRELPAGVDGSYLLLANLLSLPRAPK